MERFKIIVWTIRYLLRTIIQSVRSTLSAAPGWLRYWKAYVQYRRSARPGQKPSLAYLQPCIGDDTAQTAIDVVYYYQDAWAFEKILEQRPAWHVDVGSHHKFVSLLSKVVPTTMVDIRPLPVPLDSLQFRQGSILELPYRDGEVPSVSSICVIEHIGLGRYGDPLDPDGSEKALWELKRIVAPGGHLLISVPLDTESRTYFNAHRAFREDDLLKLFKPFEVVEKRYIFGNRFGATLEARFGTGCYCLRKPAP